MAKCHHIYKHDLYQLENIKTDIEFSTLEHGNQTRTLSSIAETGKPNARLVTLTSNNFTVWFLENLSNTVANKLNFANWLTLEESVGEKEGDQIFMAMFFNICLWRIWLERISHTFNDRFSDKKVSVDKSKHLASI